MAKNIIYGVLDHNDCHTDISRQLKRAKDYALENGYKKVSQRANMGYHIDIVAEYNKDLQKWIASEGF